MPHLAFVVFRDSSVAERGACALRALHADGSITLFGAAKLARKPGNRLVAKRLPAPARGVSAAPFLGSALAGLVVVLGGCTAAAALTAGPAIVSAVGDLAEAGLDAHLLERIAEEFRIGCAVVVAEVGEDSPSALHDGMEALHGRVLRQAAPACPEGAILRELEFVRALDPSVRRFHHGDSARLLRKAAALESALRHDAESKVHVLHAQAERLNGEVRCVVQQRASRLRAELAIRIGRLHEALTARQWPDATLH